MNSFIQEFIGTAILILFGNGVVSNVVLKNSKGNSSGWIVIALGWGVAVFLGALASGGAAMNPAGSIADFIVNGSFSAGELLSKIGGQFAGAIFGSVLVYAAYKLHFDNHPDPAEQLGCFSNAPAIRNNFWNFVTEAIATAALIFIAMRMQDAVSDLGSVKNLPLLFLVLGIGLSLGGPTGYAINPARDLGPRIAHFLLPIKGKGSSDWGYSWIPVVAPIVGAIIGAFLAKAV
jgi:glycerol uptake facilitator protein